MSIYKFCTREMSFYNLWEMTNCLCAVNRTSEYRLTTPYKNSTHYTNWVDWAEDLVISHNLNSERGWMFI